MLKTHDLLIIFACILLAFLFSITFVTNADVTIDEQGTKYRAYLNEATNAAMDNVLTVGNSTNTKIWTKENRKIAEDSVYDYFEIIYNENVNSDYKIYNYIFPVFGYIDYDGMYFTYEGQIETENGKKVNKRQTTSLNTWSETLGDLKIQYYLGKNQLTVFDLSKQYTDQAYVAVTGSYQEINETFPTVFAQYLNPDKTINIDAFNKHKNAYIISQIQEFLRYYTSISNNRIEEFGKYYNIELDFLNDETHKMITSPCLIAFMQMPIVDDSTQPIELYSCINYQINNISKVPVTFDGVNMFYHNLNCHPTSVLRYYKDRKSAAEAGARPCNCEIQ